MRLQFFVFVSVIQILFFTHAFEAFGSDNDFKEHPLDGVSIEALETYKNPKSNQFEFGLGVWPLNPYFNGFSVDFAYNWISNRTWAFALRGSYMQTVDKGLTTELADSYNVDPKNTIERPTAIAAADIKYTLLYGKFIFFNKHIRYFRSQLLAGPAFAQTNKRSTYGADLGWNIEAYVNERFSWKIELRDVLATLGSTTNNMEIVIGTAYGF